jgi:hypothetical protein
MLCSRTIKGFDTVRVPAQNESRAKENLISLRRKVAAAMRYCWLVLGFGLLFASLLALTSLLLRSPTARADVAGLPAAEMFTTYLAPVSVPIQARQEPGPKQKPKPSKSAPGQAQQGRVGPSKLPKITVCHHTKDAERPVVTITVNEHAWKAHAKHGDTQQAC